jgi:hypothetical protein
MVDMNHNRPINVERITNLLANAQNNFADANLPVRAKCAPWTPLTMWCSAPWPPQDHKRGH